MSQQLTIEQLAAATGLTVRNIREHQTRGLLPPPELQGRKGAYDDRHVARLRFIQQLQGEGLNLQAIHWLLERAPAEAADEVVRFEQALFAPWGNDTTAIWSTSEIAARLGPVEPARLQRAIDLEVIRPDGPDRWEILSSRLFEAGADLYAMGIPLDAALDVVEELRAHTRAVARTFVTLFVRHIWEPFDRQGHPPEQWEDVAGALERLRPIARQALLAIFNQAMESTVEQAAAVIGVSREQQPV